MRSLVAVLVLSVATCAHLELEPQTELVGPMKGPMKTPTASTRNPQDIEVWMGSAPAGVVINGDTVQLTDEARDLELVGRARVMGSFWPGRTWAFAAAVVSIPILLAGIPVIIVAFPYWFYYNIHIQMLAPDGSGGENKEKFLALLRQQAIENDADAVVFVRFDPLIVPYSPFTVPAQTVASGILLRKRQRVNQPVQAPIAWAR